ncbi:hypothetical protein LT679_04280 [Mucilaginibacter roseus]|uniref:Uncharacterized protein n=1 Tax=Mucilaginibacter roseus TaxID=1528868 RepID=A0ABS8TY63_9SPHI|nr:hypothetical protein [Mucilaginibacter roseus]MCD8739810.1 hypothetical protein [Mucilaginibacter roseus]
MLKRFFILSTIIFICYSCRTSGEQKSIELEHINMYLSEKHKITLPNNNKAFVVVISGNCGSCTEKTIKFLSQLGDKSNKTYAGYQKLVIIPSNNAYVIDSLKNSDMKFYTDEGYELEKYGINFPRNMFFELKRGTLYYKDTLYLEKVDTIALKYGFKI